MRWMRSLLWIALGLCSGAAAAHGQAEPTAVRKAGISIFGGVTAVKPRYGSGLNYGAMLGADFTRYYRRFAPSLEVRYTDSSGGTVGESTLQVGLKLETGYGRFRPYATLAVGYGSIVFQHPVIYPTGPYSSDNSFVYAGGGGVDYRITSTVALKADLQMQSWNLGTETAGFKPVAATVGAIIMLPFQGLSGRR